jgi:hypothetical protein
MGMANSDDEAQIAEDRALLDWAREAPAPRGYDDGPESEEESAARDHARRKHAERKPRTRPKYDR